MTREWKPGDVALVSSWRGTEQFGIRVRPRTQEDPLTWCVLDSSNDTRGLSDDEVTRARPLAVIDPENENQISRLVDLVLAHGYTFDRSGTTPSDLAAALREFADPKPVKPDEPQGLGAVVEDADGERWTHADCDGPTWLQYGTAGDTWRYYADIDAVRVLSEGVTP